MLTEQEIVEMIMDKALFYCYAQTQGFPLPQTFILSTWEDAGQAARELIYPAIIKPSYRLRAWSKHTKTKAANAKNAGELLAHYDHLRPWADKLLAQNLIRGGDPNHFTCNCYYNRQGEPVVTFTIRKLRQWLPKTGQASLAEAVENGEVVKEMLRIYNSVPYLGPNYLELKRDQESGKYFIIEPIIGPLTGQAATAEANGSELLYTMYCDAIGLPLPPNRQQTYSRVKWIHLLRGIQASIYHWCRGELTLKGWWESMRGHKIFAIFSWQDLAPFLAAVWRVVALLLPSKGLRVNGKKTKC